MRCRVRLDTYTAECFFFALLGVVSEVYKVMICLMYFIVGMADVNDPPDRPTARLSDRPTVRPTVQPIVFFQKPGLTRRTILCGTG